MNNIIWQQPDGKIAVTWLFRNELPSVHAALLQQRGDIPSNWIAVAYDVHALPNSDQCVWRWNGSDVITDADALHALLVPNVVYSWQLRRALTQQGLRASVESAVLAGSQDVQDMWHHAPEYHRNHAMVVEIATAIGKTDADIDELFILAGSIT